MSIRLFGNIIWFTTLRVEDKPFIKLAKKYDPEKHPKYVNYDAIEVSKIKDIPYDYYGEMGVPISFMNKYNPEQFEIVGYNGTVQMRKHNKVRSIKTNKIEDQLKGFFYLDLEHKPNKNPMYEDIETGEQYTCLYDRIIIKRRAERK